MFVTAYIIEGPLVGYQIGYFVRFSNSSNKMNIFPVLHMIFSTWGSKNQLVSPAGGEMHFLTR